MAEKREAKVPVKAEKPVETQREENTIFVGKKGVMSYVLAVVTQFNNGAKEVTLKARGKSISRAVDAEEITKNRFITTMKIKDVRISTEEVDNEDGTKSKVSAIEIALVK
jgi:DNA-binding protein